MTKKSMARQQRDLAAKEMKTLRKEQNIVEGSAEDDALKGLEEFFTSNTSWDDLKDLYDNSAKRLVNNYNELIQLFKTPGLLMYLEQEEYRETKVLFEGIGRDFDQLSSALKLIHDRHKDYSGPAKNQEEMLLSIEIFEDYGNYTVRYDAIITPTFTTIVERAGKALGKISEAVQEEQAKVDDADISIVKDVEYKEIHRDTNNNEVKE